MVRYEGTDFKLDSQTAKDHITVKEGNCGKWEIVFEFLSEDKIGYGIHRDGHWMFRNIAERKDFKDSFPNNSNEAIRFSIERIATFLAQIIENIETIKVVERLNERPN